MNNQFKKNINWEGAHRFCKVYEKKDKKGNTFFMGDLNHNCVITIRKTWGEWAKEGEHEVQIVPIKYTKIENEGYPPSQNQYHKPQEVADELGNFEAPGEVPF